MTDEEMAYEAERDAVFEERSRAMYELEAAHLDKLQRERTAATILAAFVARGDFNDPTDQLAARAVALADALREALAGKAP